MDNNQQRDGWMNRKAHGLPIEISIMEVIVKDVDGEHVHLCEWKPFNKNNYSNNDIPGEGYLGTATVIEDNYKGIGFHAWNQNEYEFIYYRIISVK